MPLLKRRLSKVLLSVVLMLSLGCTHLQRLRPKVQETDPMDENEIPMSLDELDIDAYTFYMIYTMEF